MYRHRHLLHRHHRTDSAALAPELGATVGVDGQHCLDYAELIHHALDQARGPTVVTHQSKGLCYAIAGSRWERCWVAAWRWDEHGGRHGGGSGRAGTAQERGRERKR